MKASRKLTENELEEEEKEDIDYAPGASSESDAKFTDSDSEEDEDNGSAGTGSEESEAEFTDSEEEQENSRGKRKRLQGKSSVSSKKATKASSDKPRRSRFLDMEAEVGDDSAGEEEDEEDADLEDFVVGEAEEAEAAAQELKHFPRRRAVVDDAEEEFDAAAEERRLKTLYGRRPHEKPSLDGHGGEAAASTAFTGKSTTSSSNLPRPFLLPTVSDPKLWLCKCQQGRERASALGLLRCVMERQFSGNPLPIFSIVARDGLKGFIYIEAHKPIHVAQVIETAKLNHCIYPGIAGRSLVLVPLAEMPQVLQTTAVTGASTVTAGASDRLPEIGSWIRIKRGRFANDLALVVDNAQDEDNGNGAVNPNSIIRCKLLPRLQFNPNSNISLKQPSSNANRPPPRPFDPEEASRHGQVSKSRGFWIFNGETYKDGFLFKNFKLSSLISGQVAPTSEELARFPGDGNDSADFASAASSNSLSSASAATLQPGDYVIIEEGGGELRNLMAVVDSLQHRSNPLTGQAEEYALLTATEDSGLEGDAARLSVKASHLRKTFRIGDSVRITSGPHCGLIGLVVTAANKTLIVYCAETGQQVSVDSNSCARVSSADTTGSFSNPTKPSSSSMASKSSVTDFSLDDLVEFEASLTSTGSGVGVIVKILDAENSVALIDSLGQLRTIPVRSLRLLATAPLPSGSNVPSASSSHSLKGGDRVIDARNGSAFKLLHLYKSLAFLRPLGMDAVLGGGQHGVSVLGADQIRAAVGSHLPSATASASANFSGFNGRSFVGKSVKITAGPHKGYVGFVKQTFNDSMARVELHTNGKVINVPLSGLLLPNAPKPSATSGPSGGLPSGAATTPAWNMPSGASRTPAWNMPTGSTRTPAWSSSRTPAWSSSKTPAWNGNATPATHASASSARTPAWNANSSSTRTPTWNAAASSGMTPAWNLPDDREDLDADARRRRNNRSDSGTNGSERNPW